MHIPTSSSSGADIFTSSTLGPPSPWLTQHDELCSSGKEACPDGRAVLVSPHAERSGRIEVEDSEVIVYIGEKIEESVLEKKIREQVNKEKGANKVCVS